MRNLIGSVLVAIVLVLLVADVLFFVLPEPPDSSPLACVGNMGCPGDPADPLNLRREQ